MASGARPDRIDEHELDEFYDTYRRPVTPVQIVVELFRAKWQMMQHFTDTDVDVARDLVKELHAYSREIGEGRGFQRTSFRKNEQTRAKAQQIGGRLHEMGGLGGMRAALGYFEALLSICDPINRLDVAELDLAWDGIGDWVSRSCLIRY
eukprot:jgi/Chrzof1/5844/Cz16g17270.t1